MPRSGAEVSGEHFYLAVRAVLCYWTDAELLCALEQLHQGC